MAAEIVINLKNVCTQFGTRKIHTGIDLAIRRGEILAIAGGSGSGKSVLLREMIMLHKPTSGIIEIFGEDTATITKQQAHQLAMRWGVMFQHGGLFSSLSVLENIELPLREHSQLPNDLIADIARWKLTLTGLKTEDGLKSPNELSGGMVKRASLARALALDPELLFLDEPTSGLDPASVAGVNELILRTNQQFGMTIVIVSHEIELLWEVCDRVAILGEGIVLAVGSMQELSQNQHPIVRAYFPAQSAPKQSKTSEKHYARQS